MRSQKKLVDGIRSLSPGKETWSATPHEELPEKVAVRFAGGVSGILDMRHSHAVVWAKLIDLQQRYDKPVYVDIDPETQLITRVLIPEISRVMSITDDGEGDVNVAFFTSQAPHYVRRENPAFPDMLAALQDSRDTGTTLLVTATRDDFEIIDVRPPPGAAAAPTPRPLSPPVPDPPVSPQRAQELFDLMSSKSCDACTASCNATPRCIPFKHATDGCYARAHEMCRLMMAEGEDPEKVWIFGSLHVQTTNMHKCDIYWGWHVAPTLMVTTPSGPPEKHVIDPSLCTGPVTVAAWKALQADPSATLSYTTWEPYWSDLTTPDPGFTQTNYHLELKCTYLQDDCVTYGPPPYVCPIVKSVHFIIDRSTFSESEITAMLAVANPATIDAAFYVVVDGFTPEELGITSGSLSGVPAITPTLSITPTVAGMTANPRALDVEDPTHLGRRQRITWTYEVTFSGTTGFGFAGDILSVTLSASMLPASSTALMYLIKQPNPYEIDGATSWLSTDLRAFQINQGQSRFGVTMGSDPSNFITQVIANLNSGSTGGQTFENDISVDQQTSRLELSQTVGGTAVYNFAVAKVRYRSEAALATDVRVFFRLFPWATSSVAYDEATAYRRHESGGNIIPLLGVKNNTLTSIPCFAASRVNSAVTSLTAQTDAANVQTIPPDGTGAEVVRYFACWLDINQATQPQFPSLLSPLDGPFSSGRLSIQDHIRNEHQCLVSEIAFSLAPISNGSTPSTSDKLAQRNLAIVESANPGLVASRRIPQTFEIRPATSKTGPDELMIDWGEVPVGSEATLYLPGFDTNEILMLATLKYHSHRMVRIDEHTLKFETGGITYVPLPFADGSFPGMLTVDLREGVTKGEVFKIVVRQVTAGHKPVALAHGLEPVEPDWRQVLGSFQLTIPVRDKAEMLPAQQRLLSNLRWIERAIPEDDRWVPVFGKYVAQVAQRVDALGGNSADVAPSATGQWQEAHRKCRQLALATVLINMLLVIGLGTLPANWLALAGLPLAALLIGTAYVWKKKCRPRLCQLLRAFLTGTGLGTVTLAILAAFGQSTPQLISALVVGAGVTAAAAITGWLKGCFA
jgi:Glutaminase